MKKLLLIIIVFFLPCNVFAISAANLVVMDLDNKRVLKGYNYDEERLIASITKIMTAIIAIENGDLDEQIVVTDIIKESFGSGIYIKVGEVITLRDLIYGLMLRSGNDAALMIAEYISGSEEEFVYKMNDYANKLNMNNTHFINPHGLENEEGEGNTSTCYDMALLTSYAMFNPTFREIFSTKEYISKTNLMTYRWINKNKLLKYDFVTGGKTGFTKKARRSLVTTGNKNNMNIVIVTLNDPNDWKDHTDLYNEIFNTYKSIKIINKDKFQVKNDKYYQKHKLYVKNNYYMTLTKNEIKKIKLDIELIKYKNFNNDDVVGNVKIKLGNKIFHNEPIFVKKTKEKKKNNNIKDWLKW